ncbi:hypothetical protein BJ546DRAFT_366017 [Cryomyces antarcticus]
MSRLHEALASLAPVDFSEVPLKELNVYMRDIFTQAELILNTVPPPPGGNDFLASSASHSRVNSAASASEITASSARPPPPDPEHVDLQKGWGKPLKLSAKENPLGIAVYKMAGHDRHGAWFARRSVHEGLSFEKWKKAMMREFPESLAVQGRPGEGNVRGIGGDRRLERRKVEGVGTMEVYQLSAQFPGPTAPREFVTLLLTSDSCLNEASAPHIDSPKHAKMIPRHYMVVSKPVKHPEAPERTGFVRGQYESVEMIREIPITPSRSASTTNLLKHSGSTSGRQRGSTIGFAESRGPTAKGERLDRHEPSGADPELNPVEWIMITRSDPGGGIPRFMVERGTPGSIVADAAKFLNWACAKDDMSDPEDDEELQGAIEQSAPHDGNDTQEQHLEAPQTNGHLAGINSSTPYRGKAPTAAYQPPPSSDGGWMSSITKTVESGIAAYAPASVVNYAQGYLYSREPSLTRTQSTQEEPESDSSDSSSINSFASAEDFQTAEGGTLNGPPSTDSLTPASTRASPTGSLKSQTQFQPTGRPRGPSHHEKELAKIEQKKAALDAKLAKKRSEGDQKTKEISSKEEKEVQRAQERHERELAKAQEKHDKELRKLEEKKKREAQKLDEKRKRAADKDNMARTQRERDEARQLVEVLKRENGLIKEQLGELQRENTVLVQKLGKTDAGQTALRAVRDELKRERSTSFGSRSLAGKKSLEKDIVGGQS